MIFLLGCDRGWLRKIADPNYNGCTDKSACNYNKLSYVDDGSCIYYPDKFNYNQSQQQAFYIIQNAEIQQDEVEDLEILTDWIGVFKDSVCVGAYPWLGYETTIPAMGFDGSSLTENYLEIGDFPAFYIFDSSTSFCW